jgi:hypothetical protein
MNNQIKTFIEFLLDTDTTSEVSFSQAILEKHQLYHERHQPLLNTIVNQKLQEWKEFYQKDQRAIADRIATNAEDEDSEQDSSSDNEEENKNHRQDQVNFGYIRDGESGPGRTGTKND